MSKPPVTAALISASILLAGLLARPVPAADADPLERRVAEIERILVRDPNRPETDVLHRLAAVEKAVALTGPPSDVKTPDELKRAVGKLAATQDELDRRLKAIEGDRRAAGAPADAERGLRDLRAALQENVRALKEMDQRVHKLESKS